MRWAGVDYGTARIGVAFVDDAAPTPTPRPLATIQRRSTEQAIAELRALLQREQAQGVVVGVPLAPDGGLGSRARQARNFGERLGRALGLPLVLQDERDSSREAMERLIEAGIPQRKRADKVDETAAVIILERYLKERSSS
jgi:putative Holliday junction resolvase